MDPRKDSVLSKDAEIFKKRDENKYEDKKNLSKEEKKIIFKQYYLKGIIIAVLILAGLTYYFVDEFILNPSPKYKLQVACVGVYFDSESLKAAEKTANDYLGFDGKKEASNIDNYGAGKMLSTAFTKFQATTAIGELNFAVFDRESFGNVSNSGHLNDITEYLNDEEKEFFKDRIVYIDKDNMPTDKERTDLNYKPDRNVYVGKASDKIKNKFACGILLKKDDKWALKAESSKDDDAIFTSMNSAKEKEISKKYMKCFCEIEMGKNNKK